MYVETWEAAIEAIETVRTLWVQGPLYVLLETETAHRITLLESLARTFRGVDGRILSYTSHVYSRLYLGRSSAIWREAHGYTSPDDLAWPEDAADRDRLADLADAAADRLRGAR